ncbi:MAG: nuclear transport factor 2 family protein [Deltaproteobacteria bacterium]|nr:nuclear transport factor 2 family protein [Deltaproteobacteria bacterium]
MPTVTCTCGTRSDAASGACTACGAELEDLSASKIGKAVTLPMAAIVPPDELARGTLPDGAGLPTAPRQATLGTGANRVFAPDLEVKPPVLPRSSATPAARPRTPARTRTKVWPFVAGGVVLAGAVAALLVLGLRGGPEARDTVVDTVVPPAPIGPETAIAPASPEHLVAAEHAAIARADRAGLLALLEAGAFGFGPDGTQVAYGANALVSTILATLGEPPPGGFAVVSRYLKIGGEGAVAWIANDLEISGGGRSAVYTTTQLAVQAKNRWSVVACHWARLVPNPIAARLAREGKLPAAAPLRNVAGGGDLRTAFERALASRKDLLGVMSARADVFNIGSAPGERLVGGTVVRRWLKGTSAELKLRDGVVVGFATEHAGWGAANVDYTLTIDGAPLTQTFRVLAVLLEDATGWKVVAMQWSNAGPVPR